MFSLSGREIGRLFLFYSMAIGEAFAHPDTFFGITYLCTLTWDREADFHPIRVSRIVPLQSLSYLSRQIAPALPGCPRRYLPEDSS